ncbi:hypothetical protein PoB_007674200 [Plakobranchus ocellatus]|uniref:Uncharacterized protein n=1 Tax=Plakobranchus ocellatus TaxID=259542 RepID=A0AAV4E0Y5_9GAST|nr:hypothetical protein PoB_007674200 [Plakobranchus ocellatus]
MCSHLKQENILTQQRPMDVFTLVAELFFLIICLPFVFLPLILASSQFAFWFLYTASPQQGDLRLSGLPSGQGADGGARTRDRIFPADLRADSLASSRTTNKVLVQDFCSDCPGSSKTYVCSFLVPSFEPATYLRA